MHIRVLLLATLLLAGCGSGGADKAGGKAAKDVRVLTLANSAGDEEHLGPFAAAVTRLSGGTLRLDVKHNWRDGEPDFEAGLIRDVRAGKADLGWAGSRAFDEGGGVLAALHAPLLIDSYAHERAVLESPLMAPMLDGLETLDLVGLGVLPGPLRKPLGVSPLVRPTDFRGATIAFQASRVAEQTLKALGARGGTIFTGESIDAYDGVEQHVQAILSGGYDKTASYLTANVNLWPRPEVVFANPKALAALDDRQRRALQEAARAALVPTLELHQQREAETAASLCRRGVTFATASPADLAALERAVRPVYERLDRDPHVKAAIERIRALRTEVDSPPSAPTCSHAQSEPEGERTPIDGVYLLSATRSELAEAVAKSTADTVVPVLAENYGRHRFVLSRGRMRYTWSNGSYRSWNTATYTVKGNTFEFTVTDHGGDAPNGAEERPGEVYTYRWSLYRDRLTLEPVKGKVSLVNFSVNAWRRVGDVP